MKARVTIYPRSEVLDPQGKAVHQALARLGFDQVKDVRVGKSFLLQLSTRSEKKAREQLEKICQELLANEVMEEYQIELDGESGT